MIKEHWMQKEQAGLDKTTYLQGEAWRPQVPSGLP